MRIRYIIKESLLLPFREFKTFFIVFLLAFLCEICSEELYSLNLGQWLSIFIIINSIISLIILGIMISLTNSVVFSKEVSYFDFLENLVEGVKEYIITIYYIVLAIIISSFFIIPTGVYRNLLHIHEYILRMDINTTFLTIHELSKSIPLSLKLDLFHSIQLNILISVFIFAIFLSFSFIGKTVLNKSENLLQALDPRVVHYFIKKVGYFRYLRFVFFIAIIMVSLVNILLFLQYYFSDCLISAILEAFVLFFSTNAFYLIISEK